MILGLFLLAVGFALVALYLYLADRDDRRARSEDPKVWRPRPILDAGDES